MELAVQHGKTIIPLLYGIPFSEWPPAKVRFRFMVAPPLAVF